MLPMNLDAIFIKLYVEENKLDYSTEENAPNVSLCPTSTTRYLFGYITHSKIWISNIVYLPNTFQMSLDALRSENKPLKQVMSLGFPFLSRFAKKMANTWTSNAIKEQGTVGA